MPAQADSFLARYGFIVLLGSLICLLIVPAYWQGDMRRIVTTLLLMTIMLSFLSLVMRKKLELGIGLVLALPTLLYNFNLLDTGAESPPVYLVLSNILFYLFIVFELLGYMRRRTEIDLNTIAAAVSVYFILGLVWAFIYALIDLSSPGAILSTLEEDYGEVFGDHLYFSFVTMTTLGYGDISPQSQVAKNWVVLQAVVGQFYIAIVVARLVALYSAKQLRD